MNTQADRVFIIASFIAAIVSIILLIVGWALLEFSITYVILVSLLNLFAVGLAATLKPNLSNHFIENYAKPKSGYVGLLIPSAIIVILLAIWGAPYTAQVYAFVAVPLAIIYHRIFK